MPAKIAHIIGQLSPGGAERQLLYIVEAMRDRGWGQSVVTFAPGGAWEPKFVHFGVPVYEIEPDHNKLKRFWRLRQIIDDIGPSLIHSWSDHTNFYLRWLPGFARNRKIFSLRGDPGMNRVSGLALAKPKHLKIYEHGGCVLSNSRAAIERLRSNGARLPLSVVVGNIVSERVTAQPADTSRIPCIFAAGRLIPLKAYDILLRALARLAEEGLVFELRIAGDGPERDNLMRVAFAMGIADRVQLPGTLENVAEEMAQSHILAHPSLSEGLSNTVLEGMAAGLPIVTTCVGAIPEVVEHGKSGYVVDPGSVEALVEPLRSLLSSPSLRVQMGEYALTYVRENCSAQVVADQYEKAYRQLLGTADENAVPPRKGSEPV